MTDLVPVDEVDTVPQVVTGRLVPRDGECPSCGRSRVQHAQFTCGELDTIRAWVIYGKTKRWKRRPR